MNEHQQSHTPGTGKPDPDDLLEIAIERRARRQNLAAQNGRQGAPASGDPIQQEIDQQTGQVPPSANGALAEGGSRAGAASTAGEAKETVARPTPAKAQPAGRFALEETNIPADRFSLVQEGEVATQENWFALLVKETLETVVLAVVIFLLIRIGIQNYRIEGSSMEPNFHHGEYLLVNKLAYRLGEYERGDVVVFRYPGDPTKDYIKRVVGLPGDTVEIRDQVLYINGVAIDEPYEVMPVRFPKEPIVVQPGNLYVLGDNRPASSDTRDWGLLDQDLVIGKAWLAIWPFSEFGLVNHPTIELTPEMAQGP